MQFFSSVPDQPLEQQGTGIALPPVTGFLLPLGPSTDTLSASSALVRPPRLSHQCDSPPLGGYTSPFHSAGALLVESNEFAFYILYVTSLCLLSAGKCPTLSVNRVQRLIQEMFPSVPRSKSLVP